MLKAAVAVDSQLGAAACAGSGAISPHRLKAEIVAAQNGPPPAAVLHAVPAPASVQDMPHWQLSKANALTTTHRSLAAGTFCDVSKRALVNADLAATEPALHGRA